MGALVVLLSTGSLSGSSLKSYKSREARVKSNASPKISNRVASRIDRFCKIFQEFFDELKMEKRSDNKIQARIFNTYDEYEKFRDRDVGKKPWSAYWSSSLNAIVLYNDQADHSLKQVLFHECFHQYLYRYTNHAPKWLNEGLAEYFEGWRIEENADPEVRINLYDLIVLQGALKKDRDLPLSELIDMSADHFVDFAKHHSDKHPNLHYATSWGLIYYLLHSDVEGDRERLCEYMKSLNQKGEKGARAKFNLANPEEFQARWRQSILAMQPVRETYSDHLLVASGYRQSREWTAAIEEYRRALTKNPEAEGLQYWIGYCTKRNGDYEEAVERLTAAREEDKKDPRPSYMIARILSGVDKRGAESKPAEALRHAREAFTRSGKKSHVYLSFVARCQSMAGDRKAAIKTMQHVIALSDEESQADYLEQLKSYRKPPK